jgi:HPt (histidine-containing phosphotransfer) domain-containing protein
MPIERDALKKLFELIGESPESLAELIDSFLDESPLQLRQMQEAVVSKDRAALGRAAHTLKSSARDFGAGHLSALCEALERTCRDSLPADAAAQVEIIAASYAPAEARLGEHLQEIKRGAWVK